MNTDSVDSPSIKAQEIATRASAAFNELVQNHGDLVQCFKDTFEARAEVGGVGESKGGIDGLTDVLAGLLVRIPRLLLETSFDTAGRTFTHPAFVHNFEAALKNVASASPESLIRLGRRERELGCSLSMFLASLFQLYVDERDVIPY
jgi:hypothetical protein